MADRAIPACSAIARSPFEICPALAAVAFTIGGCRCNSSRLPRLCIRTTPAPVCLDHFSHCGIEPKGADVVHDLSAGFERPPGDRRAIGIDGDRNLQLPLPVLQYRQHPPHFLFFRKSRRCRAGSTRLRYRECRRLRPRSPVPARSPCPDREYSPPSENESGVTFRIPMRPSGRPAESTFAAASTCSHVACVSADSLNKKGHP